MLLHQSDNSKVTGVIICLLYTSIDQKIFHAEIVVDVAKVSAETKAYQPIPIIADFTNENGSDSLRETIEANYRQVKQEVLSLVDSETARIKADPTLSHLIKE